MRPRRQLTRLSRHRQLAAALTVALAAGLGAGTVPAASAVEDEGSDLTMVQANIKTASDTFEADVARVMAQDPDFVTYNEVSFRKGELLAPEGYSLHRSVRNRYTAATPVAWKHPEWTKVEAGTFRISDVRRKPDGKHTRLGLRFANWATLRSVDGRVVSVVSVHVAPKFRIDGKLVDLIRPSVARLGTLVEQLSAAGPVLVGGDFNVHYKSRRYPRDLFADAGLVPTYDTLGNYFATGDHGGHTIDYIFNRGGGQLEVTSHGRRELASDHDAVIAGLDWRVDAPGETVEVVSDPNGTDEERLAVLRALARSIAGAQAGEVVDVISGELDHRWVLRHMRAAVARGVRVRMLTRSSSLTTFERRFKKYVADHPGSSLVRCRAKCQERWRTSGMARTFVLVRQVGSGARLRVDMNRNIIRPLVERRTRLTQHTGDASLTEGERLLDEVR